MKIKLSSYILITTLLYLGAILNSNGQSFDALTLTFAYQPAANKQAAVSGWSSFAPANVVDAERYFPFTAFEANNSTDNVIVSAPSITYSSPQTYTTGTAITALSPTNSGGAVGSYSAVSTFANVNSPNGAAAAPGATLTSGNVYATSTSGNQGYIYNASSSTPATPIFTQSGSNYNYNYPCGIVADASGTTYVANYSAGTVVKTTTGSVYTTISGFTNPTGLAFDASGNLYVADISTGDIYKVAAGTTTVTTLLTGFSSPWGVAVDNSGNVFVSQTASGTNNIIKVAGGATGGTTKTTFATGFSSPRSLYADGAGNIYVADCYNYAIKMISPGGTVTTLISSGLNNPTCAGLDASGDLYIADYSSNTIKRSTASGYAVTSGTLPAGLSLNAYTGVISGTPTASANGTSVTITATNSGGSSAATVVFYIITAPIVSSVAQCGGTVTLTASGGSPSGGTYDWYTAATGGTLLQSSTSTTYGPIAATGTFYVCYTVSGHSSSRVSATATIYPVVTSPIAGAVFSYPFTSGSFTDISGNGDTGIPEPSAAAGPTAATDRFGNTNCAYSFNGSTQYITTTTAFASPGPNDFSLSLWFNTTTTTGGMLLGFGNTQTGASTTYDRNIYMTNSGKLYFGVYNNNQQTEFTLNSTASYNDGNWHNVVATLSGTDGMKLYVDGTLIASNSSYYYTFGQDYGTSGYWRIGYNNLSLWPNAPSDYYFTGLIDDVGVYNTELTAAQIAGTGINQIGNVTSACAGNSITLSAPTITGATYSWTDGTNTVTGNPATFAAATTGSYTLTVTGGPGGCTSTATVPVNTGLTYTWTGAGGTTSPTTAANWNNSTTGQTGQLPPFDGTANLVIPSGLSYYPTLTAAISVNSLTLGSGASLNLNGQIVTIGCNIFNSSGGQILYNSTNASQITWGGAGSIASQTYYGTNTTNTAALGSMTVNNTATGGTVNISGGPVDIYSLLTITQGNLAVGASPAKLTLKSTATQTANVAAIPSAYSISGTVNVERYITGGALADRGYRHMSSPVHDAATTSNPFYYDLSFLAGTQSWSSGPSGGGFDVVATPSIYLYNQAVTPNNSTFTSGTFRAVTKINNSPAYTLGTIDGTYNMPVGNGFLNFFRGNPSTNTTTVPASNFVYTMPGVLNQGQIKVNDWFNTTPTYTLAYASPGSAAIQGFNLVGNPYACAINWNTLYNNTTTTSGICCSTNMDQAVYIWDFTTKNYAIYTNTGVGTGVASGSPNQGGSNIIASGQGFFVHALAAGAQLIFNETAKVTSSTQPTSVLLSLAANAKTVDQHLRLQLSADSVNKDESVFIFKSGASTAYVPNEDALYFPGTGIISLSNMSADNTALGINVLPFPKKSQTIPLNIYTANSGLYQLNMTEVVNIPQLFDVWLMDAYKRDSLDMKHNKTYNFNTSATDTASTSAKRFTLVIRQNPAYAYKLLTFTGAKVAGGGQLNWTTLNEDIFTGFALQRSNDGGKTFVTLDSLQSTGAGSYSYLDGNPAPGINRYRLLQNEINGSIACSNVVQLVYPETGQQEGNIALYPNPASTVINLAILTTNNTAASYTINIMSSTGGLVKTAKAQQLIWQGDTSGLTPGVYVVQVINDADKTIVGTNKFIKL